MNFSTCVIVDHGLNRKMIRNDLNISRPFITHAWSNRVVQS